MGRSRRHDQSAEATPTPNSTTFAHRSRLKPSKIAHPTVERAASPIVIVVDSDDEEEAPQRGETNGKPAPSSSPSSFITAGQGPPSSRRSSPSPPRFAAQQKVADQIYRELFLGRVKHLRGPPITISNPRDGTSPPLQFRFINEKILREGVEVFAADAVTGCDCADPEIGCSVEDDCGCLDEMEGHARRFAYHSKGKKKGTLRSSYLVTLDAIFECNEWCKCGKQCRNRLVQFGRQVPLEIFKTENRGWGLRCPKDLRKGEFIDVYRGEIITETVCQTRDKERQRADIYTFALDKFHADNEEHPWAQKHKYVVDGELFGGPTRFINHSCAPNTRPFAVSYHHADPSLYELAFFASEEIPAGTELTFDYVNKDSLDEEEREGRPPKRQKIKQPGQADCLCGAQNCRGYLWM
ncbi:MAG: hypothetical protein M4579_005884 [Chaenotheca gracillima]|nr:MAG: hypothetical protein M4579_005884 [Chaenotheca gracillima]